jgi:hypothetical protein
MVCCRCVAIATSLRVGTAVYEFTAAYQLLLLSCPCACL